MLNFLTRKIGDTVPFFRRKRRRISCPVSDGLNPAAMGRQGNLEFWIDMLTEERIGGWAWKPEEPDSRLTIELLVDGNPEAVFRAQDWRRDLHAAGKGACAFDVSIPAFARDGREYALGLRVVGEAAPFFRLKPRRFSRPVSDGPDLAAVCRQGNIEFRIESLTDELISGWAWKPEEANKRLTIELLVDGQPEAMFRAEEWRSDLQAAGKAAFAFEASIPISARDGREHELSLRLEGEAEPFFRLKSRNFLRWTVDLEEFGPLGVKGSASVPGLPGINVQVELRLADVRLLAESIRAGESFNWTPRHLAISPKLFIGDRVNLELYLNGMVAKQRILAIIRSSDSDGIAILDECSSRRLSGIALGLLPSAARPPALTCGASRIGSESRLPSFDFDLTMLKLDDDTHDLQFILDGSAFVLPLAYRRFEAGIEVCDNGVAGFVRDNHAPGRPVEIEFLFDMQPVQNVTASLPHDEQGAVRFFVPASTEWRDGKPHDVRLRPLGTHIVLPERPVLAEFGNSALRIVYQVDRWADGGITGYAYLAARPKEAASIILRQEGRCIARMQAVQPCRRLEAERLIPIERGFAFPAGLIGPGPAQIEIQIGPVTATLTLREPPRGILAIEPAGEQRRGACAVLVALRDAVAEVEEARMLLMAAAALPDDMPLTIALAGEGHALLAQGPDLRGAICALVGEALTRHLSRASVVVIPSSAIASTAGGCARAPHDFDLWARANDFSRIIAGARGGVLAYLATAKIQGVAASKTKLTILIGTITVEARVANGSFVDDPTLLNIENLERNALARVDQVIVPSKEALAAARRAGFELPPAIEIVPFSLPREAAGRGERPSGCALLFLGPLEARTGLVTFCDTVDRLALSENVPHDLRIFALGPTSNVYGVDSCTYLRNRAARWPFALEIAAGLSWDGMRRAAAHLPRQTLAVDFPELRGTAFAALIQSQGFAFITPDTERPDNPSALSEILVRCLAEQDAPTAPECIAALSLSDALAAPFSPRETVANESAATPSVTVCVSYFNRPTLVLQTLEAIAANDYPAIDIVVLDDGSAGPGVESEQKEIESWLATHNGRLVRQPNRHLGAARNAAFRHSRGAFVVFLDDDNLPCRDMISRFVQVQQATGAAIVTSRFALFEGTALIRPGRDIPHAIGVPLGPGVSAAVLSNCFGDATMLISREAFERIGGFTEDYGHAHGDWELYTRAAILGLRLETIPLPLFWYRVASNSMLRQRASEATDLLRNIRAYAPNLPPEIYRIVQLAQGVVHRWGKACQPTQERSPVGLHMSHELGWGRVAIIMRTKDRPLLLKRAMASVLGQTYQDWVLIIVNDGGEPGPVEALVAERAKSFGGRAVVIHNPQSTGMQDASNAGLVHSVSEFVVVHDDDDSWAPDFLARTIDYLDVASAAVGGVVTLATVVIEALDGEHILEKDRYLFRDISAVSLCNLSRENEFPPISFIFRRAVIDALGRFDNTLSVIGDWDFHLRVAQRFEIGVLREPLAFYHHRVAGTAGNYANTVVAQRDVHGIYRTHYVNDRIRKSFDTGALSEGGFLYAGEMFQGIHDRFGHVMWYLAEIEKHQKRQAEQLRDLENVVQARAPRRRQR